MVEAAELLAAREAFRQRDWVTARDGFAAVRAGMPLNADDLYAFATCSWWLGDLDAALPVLQEAYRLHVEDDDAGAAALVALDIGYTLVIRGEPAQGSGWLGRATRLLEDQPDRVEHGYLGYLDFEAAFDRADFEAAFDAARRVQDFGDRFADPTLVALGVLGKGRVLVKQGRVADGLPLLDEAMLAAVSDDLDPGWAGNIYCHLMSACYEIADLRRAGEWTQATARWCEQMPGAGPFLGICRVHRAQVLHLQGAWEQAETLAAWVCEEVAHLDVQMAAEAHYELGEVRRQRGDLQAAEAEFRVAHGLGRDPQPGQALVSLARGRTALAATSIRAALAGAEGDPLARAPLLPAAVEIAIATGDVVHARELSDEFAAIAATYGTTGFAARALHAQGMVLLAEGDAERALPTLHAARERWQQLPAPYEAARTRVLLARAYTSLGDRQAAAREREAARSAFARLGAADETRDAADGGGTVRLTGREAEVLGLVAAGRSNQEIASELVLSVRTVERHLASIYQKLGVGGRSARAAAVSYALREDLLART